MEPLTQPEFAQLAIGGVSKAASEVLNNWQIQVRFKLMGRGYDLMAELERKKRFAELAAYLATFSSNLEKYEQGDYDWGVKEQAIIETLLLDLELACTFPVVVSGQTLKRLEVLPAARFPTLTSLFEEEKTPPKVAQSLKKFASRRDSTKKLVNLLKSFDRTREQIRKDAKRAQQQTQRRGKPWKGENKKVADEDESHPVRIYDMMRRFVQKVAICHCDSLRPDPKAPKRHWGQLELKEQFSTSGDNIVFHAVFSKKGSVHLVEAIQWQHLRLHVSRRSNREHHGARFALQSSDDSANVSTPNDHSSESLHATHKRPVESGPEFCKLLGFPAGPVGLDIQIVDEVSDGDNGHSEPGFVDLRNALDVEVEFTDECSTSLANVLKCGGMYPGNKLLTAYVLAKSLWQFYASDWISACWTSESIQLFRGKTNANVKGGMIDWAPYYPFSFDDMPHEEYQERLEGGYYTHMYPRVLALGALLYDLGQKPGLVRQREPKVCHEPFTVKINKTAATIRNGLDPEGGDWPYFGLRDLKMLEKYRLIVEACVDRTLFTPGPADLTTEAYKSNPDEAPESCGEEVRVSLKTPSQLEQELSIEDRRAVLYRKIVMPLREILQDAGWLDENGNINRRKVKQPAASHPETPSASLLTNPSGSKSTLPGSQNDTAASLSERPEEWLEGLKRSDVMYRVVTAFDTQPQLKDERIRIAVLDTGYDPQAIFFDRDRTPRIRGWNDYVERGQTEGKDEDGHGTHVLSVLMQVAPAADIYVARIARSTPDLSRSSANVAKAIEWASNTCKANIITMSFGFDDEQYVEDKPVISDAITNAHTRRNQRIIFFAAAANDGGNRDEMFPARSRNVISIRGSDTRGWMQDFNPPANFTGETCFMTLGVNVPGASLTTSQQEGGEVCNSGTSVATPIAAGLAALVLGYAKIYEGELWCQLNDSEQQKRFNIEKISGMAAFFTGLATKMLDRWLYLKIDKFEEKRHELRVSDIVNAAREAVG